MQRISERDRTFRIWHYTVSYSQLLLQSVNVEGEESRIDLLFSNVGFMHVKPKFERLSIDRVDAAEARRILQTNIEFPPHGHVFLLNGGEFYVHGTHCQWHEDLGGPHTPSKFGPLRGVE